MNKSHIVTVNASDVFNDNVPVKGVVERLMDILRLIKSPNTRT